MRLNKEQKRIILLSSLGGLLEFYDFTIYGLFAVYFASQFFPAQNNLATLMASYGVFIIGYVVRPIGGILFSHLGDEIGRKFVLILTMILMGAASLGLALLPTYAQIGLWAPIGMILLRLLQGLAIGGELPSMIVFTAESIPHERSFAMGCVFFGTLAGLIPGMLINAWLTHALTVEQLTTFGWRIPFLVGGFLCFIAYQIRRKLHETPVFTELKLHKSFPLGILFRDYSRELLVGVGLVSIMATPIMLVLIFMPSYLIKLLGLAPDHVSSVMLITTTISVIATFISGIIGRYVPIHRLMFISIIGLLLSGLLCYFLLSTGSSLVMALSLFAIFQGILVTLPPLLLTPLFPATIRLTGVAMSYNLAFVLFGSLTPIIVTSLIQQTDMLYLVPCCLLTGVCIVALWALSVSTRIAP